jgi:hypothetical protein
VKKGLIGAVAIIMMIISLVLVSCGSPKTTTTTTTAATTTSLQPIQVLSVSGPIQPAVPGGPSITMTVQNFTALTVTSLSVVFTNMGPNEFKFDFPISDTNYLRPMGSTSDTFTLIDGTFNNDSSYPLTIEGTLQDGSIFNYTVQIKIAAPSS